MITIKQVSNINIPDACHILPEAVQIAHVLFLCIYPQSCQLHSA